MSAVQQPSEELIAQIARAVIEVPDREHAERCALFAAKLFDDLRERLDLEPGDRALAVAAALFHDAGYLRGGRDHHRKSFDVIRETAIPGISDDERVLCACAARYHGHTLPSIEHAGFSFLSYNDQRRVRRLSAIVRLAAALDASHLGLVTDVRIDSSIDEVRLTAIASSEPAVERDRLREAAGGFFALTGVRAAVAVEVRP